MLFGGTNGFDLLHPFFLFNLLTSCKSCRMASGSDRHVLSTWNQSVSLSRRVGRTCDSNFPTWCHCSALRDPPWSLSETRWSWSWKNPPRKVTAKYASFAATKISEIFPLPWVAVRRRGATGRNFYCLYQCTKRANEILPPQIPYCTWECQDLTFTRIFVIVSIHP